MSSTSSFNSPVSSSLLSQGPHITLCHRHVQHTSPRRRGDHPARVPPHRLTHLVHVRARDESWDRAAGTAPSGVNPRVDPAGLRPLKRAGRPQIQPVLNCLLAALPVVDERDTGALPPRRPLANPFIAVQQAQVQISSLQIHPVRALHGGRDRALDIPPTARTPPA